MMCAANSRRISGKPILRPQPFVPAFLRRAGGDTAAMSSSTPPPHQRKTKTVTYRVQLTVPAKENLVAMCDKLDLTQLDSMSRLVEWFAEQPATIQAAVLGLYPMSVREDIARMILQQLHDSTVE